VVNVSVLITVSSWMGDHQQLGKLSCPGQLSLTSDPSVDRQMSTGKS